MKTYINRDTCIACGNCYSICPEVYDCDEDGLAYCKLDQNKFEIEIDDELHKSILNCVEICPTESVIIKDN